MKKRNKIEKAKLMVVRKHWFQQGELAERERIIKLIEANIMTMTSPLDNSVMRSLRMSPNELIALIKGESSEREDN
jgi:hypothetical protein